MWYFKIPIMNKFIILLCSLFTTVSVFASDPSRTDILREKLLSGDLNEVLVVAHRGNWRYAPENSIAAIEHSIAIGVDIVELDLQLSKDSVLFVIHDSKLERTTTGKGKISDWTADSLRTLKLKNGAGIRTIHSLPTLEEAMLTAKGKVLVNLDKADRYFNLLMPVLEKTGTTSQVIMKGTKSAVLVDSLYGEYLDKVIYMPKIKLDNSEAIIQTEDYSSNLMSHVYELSYSTEEALHRAIELKNKLKGSALIWYNTLWDTQCGGHDDDHALTDPDSAYGYLINVLGANIIQTDRAEFLLDYLRSKSMHD